MKLNQAPSGRRIWAMILVASLLCGIGFPSTRLKAIQGLNWALNKFGIEKEISPESVYTTSSHAKYSIDKNSKLKDLDKTDGEGFNKLPEFQYESKKKRKR